jgi:putative NIF3 family GTP cyclohydrolase 1 type 2
MTINQIFDLAIKMGIKADFRPRAQIEKQLKRIKEKYEKLSPEEKEFFDQEKFINPYSDSRIYYDNGIKSIKKILAGIDIDSAELMIARYLSNHDSKKPIDLVIAHHPSGRGLADLSDVMNLQADVLAQNGVPINIAENLLEPRMEEINRKFNPENLYKEIDTAKRLDINFMNVHTPADNLVAKFIENKITKDKPEYVGEVLDSLFEIPEYREAAKKGFGPTLFNGSKEKRTGKIGFMEITGGTNIGPKIYERLADAGIGTIISMHQSEDDIKSAKKAHINVVLAGHISSDSLGMNLFLDELEKKGIEIVPCSGLIRYSRVKK